MEVLKTQRQLKVSTSLKKDLKKHLNKAKDQVMAKNKSEKIIIQVQVKDNGVSAKIGQVTKANKPKN